MSGELVAGPVKLIVAIDGPSGAGKSSVTRTLAERLGYVHIDTGAMYRAVALSASRKGVDPEDDAALARLCATLDICFDTMNRVRVNGEDVSAAIRSPEISLLTSKVAAQPSVRSYLLYLQRKMGVRGGVVLEGRDIGTVVFPDADIKFYLTATPEERGRRRYEELKAKGAEVSLAQTVAEVIARDELDLNRQVAPLCRAADAVEIDSTALSPEEVLASMESMVKMKLGQS
jgi:cytidylate kinase